MGPASLSGRAAAAGACGLGAGRQPGQRRRHPSLPRARPTRPVNCAAKLACRLAPMRRSGWRRGHWAMSELVQGQSGYHRAISVRDGRIAHRIHFIEDIDASSACSCCSRLTWLCSWWFRMATTCRTGSPASSPWAARWCRRWPPPAWRWRPSWSSASKAEESKRIAQALDRLAKRLGACRVRRAAEHRPGGHAPAPGRGRPLEGRCRGRQLFRP